MTAQSMQALNLANHTRLYRCEVRRDIRTGKKSVAEVLTEIPPELEGMRVGDLLRAQARWGDHRTRHFLRDMQIPEVRKLRHLTTRQRQLIASSLPSKGGT